MLEGLRALRSLDESIDPILAEHIGQVAARFDVTMPIETYVKKNEALWNACHDLLEQTSGPASAARGRLPYLFKTLWADVSAAEGFNTATARPLTKSTAGSATASISMEQVLQAARDVVGGSALDADAPLMDAGLDSLGATELRSSLEKAVGGSLELPATLVFEAPTVRHISEVLQGRLGHEDHLTPQCTQQQAPATLAVTISGMALRLPEGVHDAQAELMADSAVDIVDRIPASRWDREAPSLAEHSALPPALFECTKYGGFMQRVELFDHISFGMSMAEAAVTDPQQRLLLEDGFDALTSSNLARADLLGTSTGVFVGMDYTDFQHIVGTSDKRLSVHAATGANIAVAAGRTSFVFGLHGPCIATDTSCSSGLVAAGVARDALLEHLQHWPGNQCIRDATSCRSRGSSASGYALKTGPVLHF